MKNISIKPKTVIYLIDSLGSGGAQRQFVELIMGLNKNIIRPVVVIYHDLQHYREHLTSSDIPVYLLEKKDKVGLTFYWKFRRFIRKQQPVLIHSYLNTPNLYARTAKILGDVKCVITSERNAVLTRFDTILEKLMWSISDRIIVNAEKTIDTLTNEIGVKRDKIAFIPNGINVRTFSNPNKVKVRDIRERLASVNGEHLIGVVGRICEQKGQIYLVEACRNIKTKAPSFNFRVCFWGVEDEKEYCELVRNRISQYDLDSYFVFGGVESDVASVLAACDLVILPSLWEGLPNALLETLAAGRPAIATRIADNETIINDGETGFLVASGNSDELADKILYVSEMDAGRKKEIGSNAQKSIDHNYGINKLVERTMKVYSDVGIL